MFELGPEKLLILGLIVLVLFGGKRIPEIGSGLGKGIREFKRSIAGLDDEPAAPTAPMLPARKGAGPEGGPDTPGALTSTPDEPRRLLGS
ncbi:MAG TPA: twin-arginine translocase TatA/TatE family subunit [Gemmatimonadaceae bacterium]|nr:twin-arginine translocase TatA/TatE family subunit [Gemmatimonadaceae bacterium]